MSVMQTKTKQKKMSISLSELGVVANQQAIQQQHNVCFLNLKSC